DNVKEEKLDEEKTNEEEEVNELYNDVNINLEGRYTKMTDALLANVQATQVIEDTHVIMTTVTPEVQQQSSSVSSSFLSKMLNPNPDTCIDSILNLNTESTSLVDVPVTTNDEIPPLSVTTLPPPPIPLIHLINWGSKRIRSGKEPESTSAPKEKTSKSTGSSKEGSKSKTRSTDKSTQAEEEVHTNKDLEELAHQEFETCFTEDHTIDEISQHPDCTLDRNDDPRESFNVLMDTPLDFSAFVLNWLNVDTLTPELLVSPTFELMKGWYELSLIGSFQMNDDEISNLVDLHMSMLGNGWKRQGLGITGMTWDVRRACRRDGVSGGGLVDGWSTLLLAVVG
nr:hypothetical protein [Tanacetum cinerariifolium]